MPTFRQGTKNKAYEETHGKCGYCGDDLGDKFPLDHVYPKSKGGTLSRKHNLLACCTRCNMAKLGKTVEEYRQKAGIKEPFWFELLGIKKGQKYRGVKQPDGSVIRTSVILY